MSDYPCCMRSKAQYYYLCALLMTCMSVCRSFKLMLLYQTLLVGFMYLCFNRFVLKSTVLMLRHKLAYRYRYVMFSVSRNPVQVCLKKHY